MSEKPDSPASSVPEIEARLHAVAELLRGSKSMAPEARQTLAELIDELGAALRNAEVPTTEVTQLAATTAHLAEALHHPAGPQVHATLRDRFTGALIEAETHAPIAVGLARRFLDALANLGI